MIHNIDAKGQSLGRLATKIAVLLRGKNKVTYNPRELPNEKVVILNIKEIKFTGKKYDDKIYYHYSGYPGGLKSRTMKAIFEKDPKKILRLAVYRMLPDNRQRDKIIKNLEVK